MHTFLCAVLSEDFEALCSRLSLQLTLPFEQLKSTTAHRRMRFEVRGRRLDVLLSPAHRCLLLRQAPREEEFFVVPVSATKLALGLRAGAEAGLLAEVVHSLCGEQGLHRSTAADPGWPDFDAWEELVLRDEVRVTEEFAPTPPCAQENAFWEEALSARDDEIRALKWRIRQLERAAAEPATGEPQGQEPDLQPAPGSLAELGRWACRYAERLVVLPRALKGARKSHYEDPSRVFRAVQYLAEDYWRHKCGELSLAENEQALLRAGVSLSGSTTASVAGMQGEQYFVAYRGERLFLDQHLVRGGGTDPRYCMRVYFTWHAASRRVVVGWLPSHLSNTLS